MFPDIFADWTKKSKLKPLYYLEERFAIIDFENDIAASR